MSDIKQYYSCSQQGSCGIRNIFFGGELEDWKKIKCNIEQIISNIVNINNYQKEILLTYLKKVISIVNKFIEAIETKPDVEFFNKVIRQDATRVGEFEIGYTGFIITKYIDGWIRDLYLNINMINYNKLLPSDFIEYKSYSKFDLINFDGSKQNKIINTSTGIGYKYHKEVDGYSLVKAWWVSNKINDKDYLN